MDSVAINVNALSIFNACDIATHFATRVCFCAIDAHNSIETNRLAYVMYNTQGYIRRVKGIRCCQTERSRKRSSRGET